jgi:cell fate regulator YaaT (PSP1 superfamily)
MPIHLDLMPLEEKPPEAPAPKTIVVRYGYLREIGEFPSDLTTKVGCGSKLIIRTDRGTEIGELLTTTCGNGGCNKSITRDKLLSYIEESGGRDYPFSESGRVLRTATVQDLAEQSKLDEQRKQHLPLAKELVVRHNLPMKIVDVEYLLGGERVLFYFVSEQRVDFRNLVRDLAHALHTRIELRQVGARDEARLVADYEKCGQHCCCKQFLKVLTPISMRAAKVQKATLDPTKISGRCGRLMCCLRYEDETYEELRKKLPKRNTRVATEKGDGWVIDGQILTQLVLVQYDDGKREAVPMEKITGFDRPKPVLPDGRTMQTPNDRPPPGAEPPGRPQRGPRPTGAPGTLSGKQQRPQPGAPVGPAGGGDPLATRGATGGDLNTGDDIDDLIADAMDTSPHPAPPPPAVIPPPPPASTRPAAQAPRPPAPKSPHQGFMKRPPAGQRGFRPPRRDSAPPYPSNSAASVEGVPPGPPVKPPEQAPPPPPAADPPAPPAS